MLYKGLYILLLALLGCAAVAAQPACVLRGSVVDRQSGEPLAFAALQLDAPAHPSVATIADADGRFAFASLPAGTYALSVSYLQYEPLRLTVVLPADTTLRLALSARSQALREVVVTASESRGITSASKIDRTAMEHLQPTGFADLLALLPGGKTVNPDMSSAGIIALREVGIGSSDYNTSALGTQFVVDGTPLSTDANMQRVSSDITTSYDSRSSVNAGVDMRTLTTDNIESVEIVRGIPSAQYGDITAGVVIINRKLTASPLEVRVKADQYGKLYAVGKGAEWRERGWKWSADCGYLDSQNDPRNRLENYRRITASMRAAKEATLRGDYRLTYTTALDYAGNIDNVKTDPDIQTQPEDNFRSSYQSAGWSHTVRLTAPTARAGFRQVEASLSARMSADRISRTRFVGLDRDRVAPVSMTAGEWDAAILPYKYTAHQTVDGRPVNLYGSLRGTFAFGTATVSHRLTTGATWRYDKNFGDGQVYDMSRPLNPLNSTRPRRYADIPASEQASVYVEDALSQPVGRHRWEVQAGVRASALLHLSRRYALRGRVYADPRLNAQWRFPALRVWGDELRLDLSGGVGWLTKMPTLSQLYPEPLYKDLVQLNYYNNNAAYKRVNLRTYVIDRTNYDLKAARNFKWEVRCGAAYRKNSLSVTYFRERLNSGFRTSAVYAPYAYKKYDASGVDGSALTAPPALADLPYTPDTVLVGYGRTTNGSRTLKEGIEFQLSTERFKFINTRLTINGAWFKTTYENSEPQYQSSSAVIGNISLSDKYVGIYEWEDRYVKQQFNTNFILDTWIEKLGLKVSATAECTWFNTSQTGAKNGVPVAYMDIDGVVKPYTEADRTDLYKRHLVVTYSAGQFVELRTPFYMYVNFKATKDFGQHLSIALFVDRLFDCVPDYVRHGVTIRRTAAAPYFGMELNMKL